MRYTLMQLSATATSSACTLKLCMAVASVMPIMREICSGKEAERMTHPTLSVEALKGNSCLQKWCAAALEQCTIITLLCSGTDTCSRIPEQAVKTGMGMHMTGSLHN